MFAVSYYAVVGKVHACGRELRNAVHMYCSIKDGQLSDTAAVMQVRNLQVSQKSLFESYLIF